MEFDDHSNHVIELHETVSREDRLINFNSFRQKVGIKRFVLCFLRSLRGGLMVGRLAIGHEIATEYLLRWKAESFHGVAHRGDRERRTQRHG